MLLVNVDVIAAATSEAALATDGEQASDTQVVPEPTEQVADAEVSEAETPVEDVATDVPVEIPPTEAPALWLPIERVQRSPDSQPAQVLVDGGASLYAHIRAPQAAPTAAPTPAPVG